MKQPGRHHHQRAGGDPLGSAGAFEWVDDPNPRVVSYLRTYGDESILVVINLASSPQMASLELSSFAGVTPVELFGNTSFPTVGDCRYHLTLASRGYFWLRLRRLEAGQ